MGLSFVANGNIAPSRFVKLDSSAVGKVLAATAVTDPIIGISGQGTRNTPYSTLDDGYHAIAGENCRVYGDNEECWLECGGTITVGDKITPSTGGVGITTTTTQDRYGAIALQSGITGKLIKVKVVKGAYIG
jgi:hypothetical protein